MDSDIERFPPEEGEDNSLGQAQNDSRFQRSEVRSAKLMAWNTKFPPAAYFEEFQHIIPNGAERLFDQFIAESEHRRLIDTHLAGRLSALLFAFSFLYIIYEAIVYQAHWIALIFGGGMIASVITAFIKFYPDRRDIQKRRQTGE